MTNQVVWLDEIPESQQWEFHDARFQIGKTSYVSTRKQRSRIEIPGFCIQKPPALIEATIALLERHPNANVVELGISQGGSTALLTQIGRPRRLVALELSAEPVETLQAFIDVNGCREIVRPYYGVDQSDRNRIDEILDLEFGEEPIDLVIDDASHVLDDTKASFEAIFPRIRPGGLFIIEDWNWEHLRAEGLHNQLVNPGSPVRAKFDAQLRERMRDPNSQERAAFTSWMKERAGNSDAPSSAHVAARPLTTLVIELLLARAWSGDVVSELLVQDLWVTITRGPAQIGSDFRLADTVHDRFGLLPRSPV